MFEEFLKQLRHGQYLQDCSEALEEAVDGVRDSGKPATITLTIALKPGNSGRVLADAQVTAKKAKPVTESTLFFITESGGLSRRDPRQMSLADLER